jgi:hypothetical protein
LFTQNDSKIDQPGSISQSTILVLYKMVVNINQPGSMSQSTILVLYKMVVPLKKMVEQHGSRKNDKMVEDNNQNGSEWRCQHYSIFTTILLPDTTIFRVHSYHVGANMVEKKANMVGQHGRNSLLVFGTIF